MNAYFGTFDRASPDTLIRSAYFNGIIDGIVSGFDKLPAASAILEDRMCFCSSAGVANVYTLTSPGQILAYNAGLRVTFIADVANTGSTTINLNTIGAIALKRQDGSNLLANDIVANAIVMAIYDGVKFQLVSSTFADVAAAAVAAASASSSASSASSSAGSAATSASAVNAYSSAIKPSGLNVGIGGIIPTNRLDVYHETGGTAKITGTNPNVFGAFALNLNSDIASLVMVAFGSSATGTPYAGLTANSQIILEPQFVSSFVIGPTPAAPFIFAQNRVEVARINPTGEFLIGTTTDNGAYRLQVNSQIFATNATVATSDATVKRELPDLTDAQWQKVSEVPIRLYERTDRPEDGSRAGYYAQDWHAILGLDTGIVRKPRKLLVLDEGAAHALKIKALERRMAQLEAALEAKDGKL